MRTLLPTLRCSLLLLPLLAACSLYGTPPEGASAAEIMAVSRCTSCHGDALEGSDRGPSLSNLQASWQQAALADFFLDPAAAAATNPRLHIFQTMYGSTMPSYAHLTPEHRATLAAWLLDSSRR